jgi:hypothetical protein
MQDKEPMPKFMQAMIILFDNHCLLQKKFYYTYFKKQCIKKLLTQNLQRKAHRVRRSG